MTEIVEGLGWSSEEFISFINLDSTKNSLKLNTEELATRGGFGSPTMFVNEDNMFFGNDRLNLIDELLNQKKLFHYYSNLQKRKKLDKLLLLVVDH